MSRQRTKLSSIMGKRLWLSVPTRKEHENLSISKPALVLKDGEGKIVAVIDPDHIYDHNSNWFERDVE